MEELASAPEAATTTAQGDMVPVSESSDHYIKRVVRVRKQRQELFGWRLSPIDKALYVIAIDETVNYAPSAAFRSGIKFGDRITHVAGNSVSYKSDLYAMMTELKDSVEVQVDLIETPLFTAHSFDSSIQTWDELGMAYSNGMVTEVKEGSLAKQQGVELESAIIQVNNLSTLGMKDDEIISAVMAGAATQAATGHKHVSVKTMRRDQAKQLTDGIDLMLKEMPAKMRPKSIADAVNTYLSFDPLMGSTETLEQIVYKSKPDVGKSISRRLSRGSTNSESELRDVILTPSRHHKHQGDERVREQWTYMGERKGKTTKEGLPRFIVDESLFGNIVTKEIAYLREQRTEESLGDTTAPQPVHG